MKTEALVDCDWLDAQKSNDNVRVLEIDRVNTDTYDQGHIPGSLGLNWKQFLWDESTRDFPAPADFAARLGALGIDNDTTIVVFGDPVQFGTYGWWVLKYCGHKDVRLLNGGRKRWISEGRELTSDVPTVSAKSYEVGGRDESMRALRRYVLNALDRPDVLILDHRSPEEYSGERVSPPGEPDVGAERNGKIPGARHLFFEEFLNPEDETFKSEVELSELLSPYNLDGYKEIISYCRLSHRATLAYFVLTQFRHLKNVRSYDGSWTEWGSIVGYPIETSDS